MKPLILVVDDVDTRRETLISNLEIEGYQVMATEDPGKACELLATHHLDLLLLAGRMSDEGTDQVLATHRESKSHVSVIQLNSGQELASHEPDSRGEGLLAPMGSFSLDGLLARVALELAESSQARAEFGLSTHCDLFGQLEDVVPSRSPEMLELCDTISKISAGDSTTVLIEGESGAGKDVVARVIHKTSSRRDFPFLEINCAALPENLLESELFGHEKGAFTDAVTQKMGLLELAHSSTIFLDEIGEMSLPVQVKLLRVLEKMTFRRVGGIKDIAVNVRIIGATNKHLAQQVRAGSFREDLFYRLKVIQLRVPPLRSRQEDILPLARYFLDVFNRKFGKNFEGIAPDAVQAFQEYHWPGNIRELKNLMERTVLLEDSRLLEKRHLQLSSEDLDQSDLPRRLEDILGGPWPVKGICLESLVQELDQALVTKALNSTNGNQSRAARLLNMNRDKLRYRLKLYGLKE